MRCRINVLNSEIKLSTVRNVWYFMIFLHNIMYPSNEYAFLNFPNCSSLFPTKFIKIVFQELFLVFLKGDLITI